MQVSTLKQTIKVSVIIPVWNGAPFLAGCLEAVLAQEGEALEVVVVDNASRDGSAALVASSFPSVRLIRNTRNLGFAGGCNAGLRAARGDVLVLLNQDTVVRPGWLRALVGGLADRDTGIVGSKVLYPDGETLQHAGGWIEWPSALAYHCGQGERDRGQWDVPRTVEYVTGSAMGFRRALVDEIGLLDEGFWPGYYEDADYCLRAREAGYEVVYVPDAVLAHQENTSLRNHRVLTRACQRGRLRFVLKHRSPQQFLDDFVPAELAGDLDGIWARERAPAYHEAWRAAPAILRDRWQADDGTVDAVLSALERLFRVAWLDELEAVSESTGVVADPLPLPDSAPRTPVLALQEVRFHSQVPIIGPLIARIRSLWYGVAARWGVRHLMAQQQAIGSLQEMQMQSLEQQISLLRREHARLKSEIARLSGELGGGKE